MSEIHKTSANEEARIAAQAAEHKKSKQKESIAGQQAAYGKGLNAADRKPKSAFDEVLQNLSNPEGASLASEGKFDSQLKEIAREHERPFDRPKEDDAKPAEKNMGEKRHSEHSSGLRQKVVAKQTLQERQQENTGENPSHQGQRSFRQSRREASENEESQLADKKPQLSPQSLVEPGKLQALSSVSPSEKQQPAALPKALLDQIVQYVAVKKNADLSRELHIEFHDKIFHGLRLKLLSRGGQVSIEFVVSNRSAEACFKNEKATIALALGEKGIDVAEISVVRQA